MRCGFAAHLVVRDEPLAGDDEPLGGAGQVDVGHRRAGEAAVAVAVGLVNVDRGHVRVQGRDGDQLLAGERALDHLRRAVGERVGAEQAAGRHERHAHRRRACSAGRACSSTTRRICTVPDSITRRACGDSPRASSPTT